VLHSGAPWRVLFNSGFDLLLVAILPLLVLALRRRLQSESRAARRMAESEERDRRAEELRQAQLAAHARAMAAAGFAPPPVDEEAAAEPLPPGQWLPEPLQPGRESPSSPPPSTR
jgi:type II secretory pathway pseudopilin PulG